jgi:hypothetical protein
MLYRHIGTAEVSQITMGGVGRSAYRPVNNSVSDGHIEPCVEGEDISGLVGGRRLVYLA